MTDAATDPSATGADADEPDASLDVAEETDASHDDIAGAWLAVEVASLVSASVAFALFLDGSTSVALPGGSISALAATFWLLALAAVGAAGKARHRGDGFRALGTGVVALGLAILAGAGGVVLATVGGLAVTGGTLGVVVAVAGLNLVVFDVLA